MESAAARIARRKDTRATTAARLRQQTLDSMFPAHASRATALKQVMANDDHHGGADDNTAQSDDSDDDDSTHNAEDDAFHAVHHDTSGQAARNKLEAAIARIVRRERFIEIQARNAADETIYAARHDATNCIQPRKLAAALERIERRRRIRRDTLLARQVRGGFIPSYMKAWRHIGAE